MGDRLAILDYGMGNLRSVEKAFARVGVEARITSTESEIRDARGLVLPGVGAFPKAMETIWAKRWPALIAERLDDGVPLIGICLGYQLLFEHSVELGGTEGLGLLPGKVASLDAPGLKVPHIGWEPVSWKRDSPLIAGIDDDEAFYFVHSFTPEPSQDHLLGTARFGEPFAAAAASEKVFGVQFHPEKSSDAGLRLLANFATICGVSADPDRASSRRHLAGDP